MWIYQGVLYKLEIRVIRIYICDRSLLSWQSHGPAWETDILRYILTLHALVMVTRSPCQGCISRANGPAQPACSVYLCHSQILCVISHCSWPRTMFSLLSL